MNHKIGLIGGLAHRAGIFYYEQLLQHHKAGNKVLNLVLSHADVSRVLACVEVNDSVGLGQYLAMLANELFDGGAHLVAVTAVAPHLAIKEMSEAARGSIVNVLDLIKPALASADLNRVAVFGNRVVMQTNIFGSIPQQAVVKLTPSLVEEVHQLYTEIALHGKRGTQPEMDRLDEIAYGLIEQGGAQAVVLAGTDLSAFYSEQQPRYLFLDIARLHINEIMRRASSD